MPPVTGGDSEPKSAGQHSAPLAVEEQPMLVVAPNPATTWATFGYNIQGSLNEAWLVITDVQGRLVDRMMLSQNQGQYLWDSRSMEPGIYQVELVNNAQRLQVEKLVVKP